MLMVTRIIRVVTCCKESPSIDSHGTWVRWSYEVMLQIKYNSTCRRPIDIKLAKMLRLISYSEGLPSLNLYTPLITWYIRGYMTIWKIHISNINRLMISKSGRVLILKWSLSSCFFSFCFCFCFCFVLFFLLPSFFPDGLLKVLLLTLNNFFSAKRETKMDLFSWIN